MSFFDRIGRLFGGEPKASAPADTSPEPPVPRLPAPGKIVSFDVQDGVGTITLASGDELRFGRTACKGFEPAVGVSVTVEEIAPGPKGYRAKALRLDEAAGDYDALLAARDAAHGLRTGPSSADDAIATAKTLSVVTVLLRDLLPTGSAALTAWTQALGLPAGEISVAVAPDLEFSIQRGLSLTYPGRTPFPTEGLDVRRLSTGFDLGRSFLGLGIGLRDVDRQFRLATGGAPDVWDADGKLRKLARLLVALAPAATGVVLHRAGELVVPIDDFVGMLGDLDDPACRPFAAFIDTALCDRAGGKRYGTFGMDAFGLPDVYVPVDAEDAYDRARSHEAAMFAAYTMVRENRELATGEVLRAPVRVRIGAFPVQAISGVATRDYTVVVDGSHLGLDPIAAQDERLLWRDQGAAIAPAIYQSLFDHGLRTLVPSDIIRDVGAEGAEIPHRVEVRARRDRRGYLTVTNGFGRAPHERIHQADCAFFELGAWSEKHSLALLRLVGTMADDARGSAAGGWKPFDLLHHPIPPLGIGGFVLADGGAVSMGPGPSVRLLLLVPLSVAEYASARGGQAQAWLEAHPVDGLEWTRLERAS